MSAAKTQTIAEGGEKPTAGLVDAQTVEATTADWPAMAKSAAKEIIGKYGLPNEATASRLIWYKNGPWKRTIVYRDEIPHNFPQPHTDVVEQFIDYRVPLDTFSELAHFDGSIIVERTKGEVSARCDMEAANFLAINLMHEIVTGQRTVGMRARRTPRSPPPTSTIGRHHTPKVSSSCCHKRRPATPTRRPSSPQWPGRWWRR